MASRNSGGTSHVLPEERRKASFDIEGLKKVVCGSRPTVRENFKELFAGSEFDATHDDYLSYSELCEAQLNRTAAAISVVRNNPELMIKHQARKIAMSDLFDTGAIGIGHFDTYLPFLQTNASDEQKKAWLPAAVSK